MAPMYKNIAITSFCDVPDVHTPRTPDPYAIADVLAHSEYSGTKGNAISAQELRRRLTMYGGVIVTHFESPPRYYFEHRGPQAIYILDSLRLNHKETYGLYKTTKGLARLPLWTTVQPGVCK